MIEFVSFGLLLILMAIILLMMFLAIRGMVCNSNWDDIFSIILFVMSAICCGYGIVMISMGFGWFWW